MHQTVVICFCVKGPGYGISSFEATPLKRIIFLFPELFFFKIFFKFNNEYAVIELLIKQFLSFRRECAIAENDGCFDLKRVNVSIQFYCFSVATPFHWKWSKPCFHSSRLIFGELGWVVRLRPIVHLWDLGLLG